MNINIPTGKIKELAGYGLVLGVITFVSYIAKAAHNMNTVADKVGKSVDEIADSTHVDVSEAVVNEAVYQVIEKNTSQIVERSFSVVVDRLRDYIQAEVESAVNKARPDIEDGVRRELERQTRTLDINSLKNEIIEKVRRDASAKLDHAVDDTLDEFNGNLKNIRKIYSSISKAMTGNGD